MRIPNLSKIGHTNRVSIKCDRDKYIDQTEAVSLSRSLSRDVYQHTQSASNCYNKPRANKKKEIYNKTKRISHTYFFDATVVVVVVVVVVIVVVHRTCMIGLMIVVHFVFDSSYLYSIQYNNTQSNSRRFSSLFLFIMIKVFCYRNFRFFK